MKSIFPEHRALPLDGGNGSVMCRMHLQQATGTIPSFSEGMRLESATRSLLRMKNLTAVRGGPGHSMVGPADYYTNLERPHQQQYTIEIDRGIPQFHSQPVPITPAPQSSLKPLKDAMMTQVSVNWVSGREANLRERKAHYESSRPTFGESLFPTSGILEIKSASDHVVLPSFDPRNVDLSSFKARLVANNAPFQITSEPLPEADEYRAVSFFYDPGYASHQIEQGGGLFLEAHDFSQTMTPLDSEAKGYVTLGKWNDAHDALDLIAIQVPYGYTLIIDKDCIHGDATLDGMFMMCMTSNHVSMETANTVFLKHPDTKRNITFDVSPIDIITPEAEPSSSLAPRPYVLYQDHTQQDLQRLVNKMAKWDLIFNPFSMGFWALSTSNTRNSTKLQLLGGAAILLGGAILAMPLYLELSIAALAVIIAVGAITLVAGCGFFAVGTADKIKVAMENNALPTQGCMA